MNWAPFWIQKISRGGAAPATPEECISPWEPTSRPLTRKETSCSIVTAEGRIGTSWITMAFASEIINIIHSFWLFTPILTKFLKNQRKVAKMPKTAATQVKPQNKRLQKISGSDWIDFVRICWIIWGLNSCFRLISKGPRCARWWIWAVR